MSQASGMVRMLTLATSARRCTLTCLVPWPEAVGRNIEIVTLPLKVHVLSRGLVGNACASIPVMTFTTVNYCLQNIFQ